MTSALTDKVENVRAVAIVAEIHGRRAKAAPIKAFWCNDHFAD